MNKDDTDSETNSDNKSSPDLLLHKQKKKDCIGNRRGNLICNKITGKWMPLDKLDKYEKTILDKYANKDYIEFKKHKCNEKFLNSKLNKINGMSKDDYECNYLTGKWNKKSELNYIINPEIKNNKELDVPSNLYNYYKKYIILPELKKNPDYIRMYKDKISIKKEVLDKIVKEDWLKLKNENGPEYMKIKNEYEKLVENQKKILSKKNIKQHIGVKINRTGKHTSKTYNGWSLFLHRYKVKGMKSHIRAIDKSKIMADIWHNKLTQKERDDWGEQAVKINNELPVIQTKEELITGNALLFSEEERNKISKTTSLDERDELNKKILSENDQEEEELNKINKINKKK